MSTMETAILAAAFFGASGLWWLGHPRTNARIRRLEARLHELEGRASKTEKKAQDAEWW